MTGEAPQLYCTVILWDLGRSGQTVASLRAYLRDYAVEAYAKTPGLRQKVWISSTGPEGEQWGAVYLWDSEEAAYGRPPGVSKVVDLIGYRPTERRYFSVEAATEGLGGVAGTLTGVGLAYRSGQPEPLTRPQEFVPPGADAFIPAAPGAAPLATGAFPAPPGTALPGPGTAPTPAGAVPPEPGPVPDASGPPAPRRPQGPVS
ncbi:hypothetical protein ACFXOM_03045 [Streptomyces sp. NPDC059169]|uniref:hypothetical protein n=1 Tax=Streptomyces sp. NPDC059169 TaxID=3346754 RepID=UPI00369E4EC4